MKQFSRCAALLLAWLSLSSGGQAAEPDLKEIITGWNARRTAVRTVRYAASGTQTLPPILSPDSGIPAEIAGSEQEMKRPASLNFALDRPNGRFRLELNQNAWSGQAPYVVPNWLTMNYDGKVFQTRHHHDRDAAAGYRPPQPVLDVVRLGSNFRSVSTLEMLPLLWAYGIVPLPQEPLTHIDQLKGNAVITEKYWQAVGVDRIQNRECVVLRSDPTTNNIGPSYHEFIVDPARQGAILKGTLYSRGKPHFTYDVEYALRDNFWAPKSWTMSMYHTNGKLLPMYQFNVTEVQLDPAFTDADFAIPLQPGMVLQDKGVNYTVAADGQLMSVPNAAPVPVAVLRKEAEFARRYLPITEPLYYAGAAVVLLIVIGLLIVLRSRHLANQHQTLRNLD